MDAAHRHHGQQEGERVALGTGLPSFTSREVAASRMNLGRRGERRLFQGERETG